MTSAWGRASTRREEYCRLLVRPTFGGHEPPSGRPVPVLGRRSALVTWVGDPRTCSPLHLREPRDRPRPARPGAGRRARRGPVPARRGRRRQAVAAVAARDPHCLQAWADLAELADDPIDRYAFARVGYHRGLDALAGRRLARLGLRALAGRAQPRLPPLAAHAAAGGRVPSARSTRKCAATCSCANSTPSGGHGSPDGRPGWAPRWRIRCT